MPGRAGARVPGVEGGAGVRQDGGKDPLTGGGGVLLHSGPGSIQVG